MGQISVCDSRAVVAHAKDEVGSRDLAADVNRRALGGILCRVFEQMRQRRGGQARVQSHGRVRFDRERHAVLRQRLFDLITSGRHDLRRVRPTILCRDGAGINARHFEDIVEQAHEAFDFGKNQVTLFRTAFFRQPRRFEICGSDANRGQRGPQVVTERGQQCGLELLALACQLRALPLVEEPRPLNRDGDHASQRVESPGLHRPPRSREETDWGSAHS
jgi:hypothetical protein